LSKKAVIINCMCVRILDSKSNSKHAPLLAFIGYYSQCALQFLTSN